MRRITKEKKKMNLRIVEVIRNHFLAGI